MQNLRRKIETMKMEEKEGVGEYLGRMQVLTNQLNTCGEPVKEHYVVEKVLRTLHPRFDHIVVAIEESKDLESLTLEELQYSLEAHELRINERNAEKEAVQALFAQNSKKDHNGKKKKFLNKKGKKNKGNFDHKSGDQNEEGSGGKKDAADKGSKKPWNKKNVQCYDCQG